MSRVLKTETIVTQMKAQRERLANKLSPLQQQMSEIQSQIDKLDTAITAMQPAEAKNNISTDEEHHHRAAHDIPGNHITPRLDAKLTAGALKKKEVEDD